MSKKVKEPLGRLVRSQQEHDTEAQEDRHDGLLLMAPNGSAELGSYELPIPEAREGADRPYSQDLQAPLPNAMLARNALWFCRLRWIVIATLAGLGIVSLCGDLPYRLGLKGRGGWALVTAVLLSVYNTAFLVHARHARRSARPAG